MSAVISLRIPSTCISDGNLYTSLVLHFANRFFLPLWNRDNIDNIQYEETEKRREMAKNSLERYTHYYERWTTNQYSNVVFNKAKLPYLCIALLLSSWNLFSQL
ncbi:hypothetical protein Syun_031817 [Stephania yunnanensis]|uniref:Uncharacterized protein n=2 Tax=Stephania yunnanensis TaxID=152371 RepID=A0AAP0DWS9_9MAGN